MLLEFCPAGGGQVSLGIRWTKPRQHHKFRSDESALASERKTFEALFHYFYWHIVPTGDPLLFDFNQTGSQALVYQPSYWVLGHFSRFARPGATVVATSGRGIANDPDDYEAVRAYYMDVEEARVTGLKLMATAFVDAAGRQAIVVVANANDKLVEFKLRDGNGRAAKASIPAKAIQTYTWAL
eukprot:SAG31_NODE_3435_length_4275_cov_15.841954_2_plen_183_part_00